MDNLRLWRGPDFWESGDCLTPEVDGSGRFRTPAREFVPAYLETWESGRLREKLEEALEALRACTLCPRHCEIDRLSGRFAVCKSARYARVSSYFPHFGEEDVLRGWQGSGTIFFGWCNLRCVQNYETSQQGEGVEVGPPGNINFVTPEHIVPQILESLPYAIEQGLQLPIVYNTSAYDSLHSIRLMEGSPTSTCRTSSCGIPSGRAATCSPPTIPRRLAG